MKPEELGHIRADVRQAIVEAQQHDPTVALEILWRLFDAFEIAATGATAKRLTRGQIMSWAEGVLRDVQTRAVSKVPYSETPHDEPEDHRDQPRD